MKFIRRKRPDGYKELLVYKRATELQEFIYQITEKFPWNEKRRREHMRDSARSVKQNIVEGWKRETTQQYIDFLSFSFGSLGELKEDGEDCIRLKLISLPDFEELMRRCGELDYLMGRLKSSLERKVSKEEIMSPYDRWLGREMEKSREEDRKMDEELRKIVEEARAKREEGVKGEEEIKGEERMKEKEAKEERMKEEEERGKEGESSAASSAAED